ncbi:MAG TPA: hypothetical protein VFW22_13080 [Pseudolabrys sp.]|nr:hypothetical protein [Pseudolabrys sp.]
MFHITCGMDPGTCQLFEDWFNGQPTAVKVAIMAEVEKLKMAGLPGDDIVQTFEQAFEAHVLRLDAANCYFALARYFADNKIVCLGWFRIGDDYDRIITAAIDMTCRYFRIARRTTP